MLNVNIFLQLTCKHTDALTLIQYKTVILLFNILLLMDQVSEVMYYWRPLVERALLVDDYYIDNFNV